MKYLVLLMALACLPASAAARTTEIAPTNENDVLVVGLHHRPPYCTKGQEGGWSGMAVELWRAVAESADINYRLKELDQGTKIGEAMLAGSIDVAISSDLSYKRVDSVRFLQQHHATTMGVATPRHSKLTTIIKGFFTWNVALLIAGVFALVFVFGALLYFIERKPNPDDFGGERSLWEGIGTGFWWSGVTMTTIGYGDKAPLTFAGRATALLWALLAMAITAGLTATLVSAANENHDISFPEELKGMRIGAVKESPAAEYLDREEHAFDTITTLKDGIQRIHDKELDAVVADATALTYVLNDNDHISAFVHKTEVTPVAYAIMVRENTGVADSIDAHLIKYILSPTWGRVVREYGGEAL